MESKRLDAIKLAVDSRWDDLRRLVEAEPATAQQVDSYGMLPLHWACTDPQPNGEGLLLLLLKAFPKGAQTTNAAELLPLQIAIKAQAGIEWLQALLAAYPNAVLKKTSAGESVIRLARTSRLPSRSVDLLQEMYHHVCAKEGIPALEEWEKHHKDPSKPLRVSIDAAGSIDHRIPKRLTSSTTTRSRIMVSLPPRWMNAPKCSFCDQTFSTFRKRHHCRNCGQSICGDHSARERMKLPHYGLSDRHRVCVVCHDYLSRTDDRYANQLLLSDSNLYTVEESPYDDGGGNANEWRENDFRDTEENARADTVGARSPSDKELLTSIATGLVASDLLSLLKERCTDDFVVFRSVVDRIDRLIKIAGSYTENSRAKIVVEAAAIQLLGSILKSGYSNFEHMNDTSQWTIRVRHCIIDAPRRSEFSFSIHKKISEIALSSLSADGSIKIATNWEHGWRNDRRDQAKYLIGQINTITASALSRDDMDTFLQGLQFWRCRESSMHEVEHILIKTLAKQISFLRSNIATSRYFGIDPHVPRGEVRLSTTETHVSGQLGEWLDASVYVYPVPVEQRFAVKRWFSLNHPHIVNLLGLCESQEGLLLLCENYDSMNLDQYLLSNRNQCSVWQLLYKAALGLQYIHESGMIHGPMRCSDILVGNDGIARIGNLGWNVLHKHTGDDETRAVCVHTGWESPEDLTSNATTQVSDVYSFGMTVIEAVTDDAPYNIMIYDEIVRGVKEGRFPRRPPKGFSNEQWELVKRMCAPNAAVRIPIHEVVCTLSKFADEAFRASRCRDENASLRLVTTAPARSSLSRTYRRRWSTAPSTIKSINYGRDSIGDLEDKGICVVSVGDDGGDDADIIEDTKTKTRPPWYIPQHESWTAEFEPCGQTLLTSCFLGTWMEAVVVIEKMNLSLHASRCLADIADAWYKLKHPNVLHLFGACHDAQTPFFVREYAPLGTLNMYLQSYGGQFSLWRRIFEIACALRYLHSRGIVHSDIRCDNVLVTIGGKAKLSGFHSCSALKNHSFHSGTTSNARVRWAAPEILNGEPPSPESDVYSLGMLMIEALTRKIPWGDRHPDIRVQDLVAVKHKIPPKPKDAGETMWTLIQRMCLFDPSERAKLPEVVRLLKIVAAVESQVPWQHDSYENDGDRILVMELILERYFEIHDKPDIVGQYCPRNSDADDCVWEDDDELQQPVNTVAEFAAEDVFANNFEVRLQDARVKPMNTLIKLSQGGVANPEIPGRISPEWLIDADELEVEDRIAFGGFGSVHYGTWLGAPVAIKIMKKLDVEAFQRELNVWYGLNHPFIVTLFGGNTSGNKPFFVCDLADSSRGCLGKAVTTNNKQIIWKMLYQSASALQYLHSRDTIHADLKGNNILIKEDGNAQITDFGLSLNKTIWTRSRAIPTTAAVRWKAPECLGGQPPSKASDIYSLGMLIVEAMTGELPWNLKDELAVSHRARKCELPTRPSCFSDAEWGLVKLMCRSDPEERLDLDVVMNVMRIFAFDALSRIENHLFVSKLVYEWSVSIKEARHAPSLQHSDTSRPSIESVRSAQTA